MSVYEIAFIERRGGNKDADARRLGRRVIPVQIERGSPAILVQADNPEKTTITSIVETKSKYVNGHIEFTTRNTKYILRKVDD